MVAPRQLWITLLLEAVNLIEQEEDATVRNNNLIKITQLSYLKRHAIV